MSTIAPSNEQLLQEIREVNLAYLMLAQHMIRADKAQALYRLGVSEEVASIIDQLTPAQLMKTASSNQLILRFRFDDDMVWNLLTSHSKSKSTAAGAAVAGLHANIVMAGQLADLEERRAWVEQPVDAVPHEHLVARLVLLPGSAGAASRNAPDQFAQVVGRQRAGVDGQDRALGDRCEQRAFRRDGLVQDIPDMADDIIQADIMGALANQGPGLAPG